MVRMLARGNSSPAFMPGVSLPHLYEPNGTLMLAHTPAHLGRPLALRTFAAPLLR